MTGKNSNRRQTAGKSCHRTVNLRIALTPKTYRQNDDVHLLEASLRWGAKNMHACFYPTRAEAIATGVEAIATDRTGPRKTSANPMVARAT